MSKKKRRSDEKKIVVVEEQLHIEKIKKDLNEVIITKKQITEEVDVEIACRTEKIVEKRISINKYVDEIPAIINDGDKVIIPVIKEEIVIVKKYLLVEEIHIERKIDIQTKQNKIPIKKDVVKITRKKI